MFKKSDSEQNSRYVFQGRNQYNFTTNKVRNYILFKNRLYIFPQLITSQGRHQDFNPTKAKIQNFYQSLKSFLINVAYEPYAFISLRHCKKLSRFGYFNTKVQEACNIIFFLFFAHYRNPHRVTRCRTTDIYWGSPLYLCNVSCKIVNFGKKKSCNFQILEPSSGYSGLNPNILNTHPLGISRENYSN